MSNPYQNIHELGQETINRFADIGHQIFGSISELTKPIHQNYNNNIKWLPYTNVTETENNIKILLTFPGVTRESIKAKIIGNILHISAVTNVCDEDNWIHLLEQNYVKEFSVPSNTKMEDVNIKYLDGILKIIIQKHPSEQEENIPID